MSFRVPDNLPSFSSSQRSHEDEYWRAKGGQAANGRARGGVRAKLNEFISEGRELPMYKDKPHYPSRRKRNLFQRKRTVGILLALVATCLWWIGSQWRSEDSVPAADTTSISGWSWFSGGGSRKDRIDWSERREQVRQAFITSWDGYEKYAWGLDEYYPVSKKGRNMVEGGMGWMIVDALDTMMMMNLTRQVRHAREWIATSLNYNANHDVNTFETTIRMLGGLLSAHYLSTTYPHLAPIKDDDANQLGEDLYIKKATDLAERILGAFDSGSGIPYASVNLNKSLGLPSKGDGGASSTAEAATVQLEYKYLAKLTGETRFWEKAEKILEVIDAEHREGGLLPIYIYADAGTFRGENIRLGSRGDSYYEYLIKQYLQTSENERVYLEMWNEALEGIKKHLLTYTREASLTVLGERPSGLHDTLSPKMDHLVCFMPGTIALAVTGGLTVSEARVKLGTGWTARHDENMHLARELMKTCWGMYRATATGLAPEITYFNIDDPPRAWVGLNHSSDSGNPPPASHDIDPAPDADWRVDYSIHRQDTHNLQRPETVESLFYMYRITQDPIYRAWGWEMFQSFVTHTAVHHQFGEHHEKSPVYGYTSLDNADKIPPTQRDSMESFWLAETLKYFWLLFGPEVAEEWTRLDTHVINTEAHFFPRFEMGKLFKTGWARTRHSMG